ncbi:hypothetical protein Tco_0397813 [Tanacetum coccineum]
MNRITEVQSIQMLPTNNGSTKAVQTSDYSIPTQNPTLEPDVAIPYAFIGRRQQIGPFIIAKDLKDEGERHALIKDYEHQSSESKTDWDLPFELRFDASDFATGKSLGQAKEQAFPTNSTMASKDNDEASSTL